MRSVDLETAEELLIEAIDDGHLVTWRATGSSMWPWIRSGSLVRVRFLGWAHRANVELGAVVLRYGEEIELVHRVRQGGSQKLLITRGDTVLCDDPPPGPNTRIALVEEVVDPSGFAYKPDRLVWRLLGRLGTLVLPFVRGIHRSFR